jgi:serine/threonine protein phosphatase PrpC
MNNRPKLVTVKQASPIARIGVSTRKGTSAGKSVNEDAFFIAPIAGDKMWLLAIADGVTGYPHGWWASNKCAELIWRTLPNYEEKLLSPNSSESGEKIMQQWLNEIHEIFCTERRDEPKEKYKEATSTLTFAVVRESNFFWAHCGDSRLYALSPYGELSPAFPLDDQKSKSGEERTSLSNHIGAPPEDWKGISGSDTIPPDGLLILCSDGVISGNEGFQKINILKTIRDWTENLQKGVEEITKKLADLGETGGETDDLTLIAFQPVNK